MHVCRSARQPCGYRVPAELLSLRHGDPSGLALGDYNSMKYLGQFTRSSKPHTRRHSWHRAGAFVRFRLGILLVAAGVTVAHAETLPLPSGLIALDSDQGQRAFFA